MISNRLRDGIAATIQALPEDKLKAYRFLILDEKSMIGLETIPL
jgi:hypothetical protein